MSLTLEYRNTTADILAHHELLTGNAYRAGRAAYYRQFAFWSVTWLLGAYAAFKADEIALMCALMAVGILSSIQSLPYSRLHRAAMEQSLIPTPDVHIRLEVLETGLRETLEDVVSHAPWSSIKKFTIYRDIVFIELAGGRWALIPHSSAKPCPSVVDDLIQVLRNRGIQQTTGPKS